MLTVHQLKKSYGIDTVLENITFSLSAGDRLGLVGPNGCGKTTLLRILAGLDKPDAGAITWNQPHLQVGYLPQGFIPGENGAGEGETLGRFVERMAGDLPALTARLESLSAALARGETPAGFQQDYDLVLADMQVAGENAGRAPAILAALGLEHLPDDLPLAGLSGGQKTRLALAGVLLSGAQCLLLDEPTNHLDLEMLAWLEDFLLHSPGSAGRGVLVVSHDRAFLDKVATGILELDAETHGLRLYTGNYSDYLEAKLVEREAQWQAYKDQQDEIGRLRYAAERVRGQAAFRKGGKGDSGDKFAKGFFSDQSRRQVARAKSLERRLERLLTDERIDKPRQSWQMKLEFEDTPASGRQVIVMDGLSVGYGENVLLSEINVQVRLGARVALVGPNGTGKTTLLRTIAGKLEPLAGRVRLGSGVRLGYMAQEQEDLDPEIDAFTTLLRLAPFSETEGRAFLHKFLFSGDEVFLPVGKLSYGERARLSLACLVAQGCNLLLLDEPINHLDLPSRARFELALGEFEGTILAVVHDRYFIQGFAMEIWEVEDHRLVRHFTEPVMAA